LISRLTLEYDGGPFAGWAEQPGERTVAAELRRALEILASPAADAHRALQVQQQFELAQIREALEAARGTTAGTKVVVRIDA
jgi:tRNA U38,U39,U40 pseudouridine synthase TruA